MRWGPEPVAMQQMTQATSELHSTPTHPSLALLVWRTSTCKTANSPGLAQPGPAWCSCRAVTPTACAAHASQF